MIENELQAKCSELEIVVLCQKFNPSFIGIYRYFRYTLKCMKHLATSRVCIVDSYCIPLSILKHKKGLTVFQIWHALGAIKKFGYQSLGSGEGRSKAIARSMKMHENYDYVFCASKATGKFYSEAFNVPIEKVIVTGMPRVDYILKRGKDSFFKNRMNAILKEHPDIKDKKNILYIPTFRKGRHLDVGPVNECFDTGEYNIIVKLHPLEEGIKNAGNAIIYRSRIFELLHYADYIITDYSAVAFEASLLNKPVYFYVHDIEDYSDKRGINIALFDEMSSSTFTDINDIKKKIIENEYDYNQLKAFRKKYVETAKINNTESVCNAIVSLGGLE